MDAKGRLEAAAEAVDEQLYEHRGATIADIARAAILAYQEGGTQVDLEEGEALVRIPSDNRAIHGEKWGFAVEGVYVLVPKLERE